MKITRFNEGRLGVVVDDQILDLTDALQADLAEWPPTAANRLIARLVQDPHCLDGLLRDCPKVPLASAKLLTPVPWPNKVIAYPVNYHDHGREMQANYRATHQGFFLKPNSSLSGASEPILLPEVPGREVHHECELGIVIGKGGRNIRREDWREHVFGYSCLLDMVVRGREERVFRKAYDTFCPVGPWIATADEVGDPTNLDMKLWVNDEVRQQANTRDLVLDIPGMIEMASAVMTLYPGDIIATGTPAGVGPVVAGDLVRIRIERVGEMTVRVEQGRGGSTEVFAAPYVPDIKKQS